MDRPLRTPEEQRAATERFLADAKETALREFQAALYKIATKPRWWCYLFAKPTAQYALGIGPWWNRAFKK